MDENEIKLRMSLYGNRIDITQADINNGRRGDPQYCPLAIAIRRTYRHHKIEVVASGLYIDGILFGIYSYLADAINKYDQGFEMRPTTIQFIPKDTRISNGNLIAPSRVLTDMQIEEIKMNEIPISES